MVLGGRYRTGDVKPRHAAVDSATVISKGDHIYLDTGKAKPASDLAWGASLAATQEAFHDAYLGIAMADSAAGDTDDIPYATQGEFEFDCASATFETGTLLGLAKASGNALENQKLVAVATPNLAVGRASRQVATAATSVHYETESVINGGGPRASA